MKTNQDLNLITVSWHIPKNANKRNTFIDDKSYTIFYEKKTKKIYTAGTKNISSVKFMLIFLIFYPIMNYFPNNIIPYYDNLMFFLFSFIILLSSLIIGKKISEKSHKDLKKIILSKEKWKDYLEKGNEFYPRQIISMTLLLLFTISFYILLYIYQSKWWLFGAIGIGIVIGTSSTIFSKTRYLLYKNKLDVNLQEEENSNENITDW